MRSTVGLRISKFADHGKPVDRRKSGAKDTFSMERTGVAAMALGIIDRCLDAFARQLIASGFSDDFNRSDR